jgi:DNA-binding PadR family transcriptional regulator
MSVNHAILGVLLDGPRHGYQVASELEERIAGGRYNSAQIYQGLRVLAGRGFVLSEHPEPGISRDRRPFSITEAGRHEFERWLRTPLTLSRPMRDEAVVKVVFLGRRDPARLLAFLERLRRQHVRSLAALSAPNAHEGGDVWTGFSATVLRIREDAELRWIDHVIEQLAAMVARQRADRTSLPTKSGTNDAAIAVITR